MKKFGMFSAVLFVLTAVFWICAFPVYAEAAVCSLSAEENIKQGAAFDIILDFENSPFVGSAEAELVYDSSMLKLSKAEFLEKKTDDVFGYYDNGGKIKLTVSVLDRTVQKASVRLRFAPLNDAQTDFCFRVTKCCFTNNGSDIASVSVLPVLDVTAAVSNAGVVSTESKLSSKEERQTSRKTSDGSSRTSSKEGSGKNSKSSEKKSSISDESETADTVSDEEEPLANTYYIQHSHDNSGNAQTVFITAAGTAVISILLALIFFRFGRGSSKK